MKKVLLVLLVAGLAAVEAAPPGPGQCKKPLIEITVSAPVNRKVSRFLDLSWYVEDHRPGDRVVLYFRGPPSDPLSKELFSAPALEAHDWVRTTVQEQRDFEETEGFERKCNRFWAAYWRANATDPLVVSCLGTQPRWMEESKEAIKGISLRRTFLPGTHDSGSFLIRSGPFWQNRYQKYVYTQDESILSQLIHGARILDLRIGHYKGIWWINHDIVKVHPFEYAVSDIKLFLENTNEIVVLDFHRFPVGFKERATHDKFVAYLVKELGEHMAPPSMGWGAPLEAFWNANKRLIVAYNNWDTINAHSSVLWSPVSQKWGDVIKVPDLFNYLQKIFASPPYSAYTVMAQLTPTPWSVIADTHKGLRGMADLVNMELTKRFRAEWGDICNGVAVDFLRSTGIVEAAIRANKRRATGSKCDPPN